MGYAVVHMMKIKSGAVGGIQSHNNREHEPKTNPDVDMRRSAENYDLVPCQNYQRAIKEKLSDLVESSRAVRKDAVVVCNFIVTSDNATMEALGADGQRAFFSDSVKWFSDRYGADRVLNATVHMDETTPHLHIGVMPITQDGRLSAKAIFTKTELKAIQTEFARDVGEKYGLERGVEGSDRTHLSEIRYKQETAFAEYVNLVGEVDVHQRALEDIQQDIETATQRLSEARRTLETVKSEVESIQEQKTALEGKIAVLEGEISERQETLDIVVAGTIDCHEQKTALEEQIGEAKAELEAIETAVKRKKDEGVKSGRFFDMNTLNAEVKKERERAEKEKRLGLLEKFVSLPQIKPLWEQFCQMINREKSRRKNGLEK